MDLTRNLEIRHYEGVQSFTSDLLDTFLEYKTNVLHINDAINDPSKYEVVSHVDAVALDIESLVKERKATKDEMRKIVDIIHTV